METGWQGAFRSREFFGPYEERIVLEQGDTDVNGPHQGGWVRTPSGEDWFLHFQQRGAYGRVVHLQPMSWGTDGWPLLGDGGAPVAVHRRPDLPPQSPAAPATDDDFPGGRFGRQWSWTANPQDGWATHHSGDGLRLTCVRSADTHDLRRLPNVLTQRLPGVPSAVEVELKLHSEEPGARAGLAVLGDAFGWIGLERGADGTVQLVHRFAEAVAVGAPPTPVGQWGNERDAAPPRLAPEGRVRLRIEIGAGARCRFFHDLGEGPRPSGPVFAATPGAGSAPCSACSRSRPSDPVTPARQPSRTSGSTPCSPPHPYACWEPQ